MVGKKIRFFNFILDTFIFFTCIFLFFLIFKGVIKKEDVKWISLAVYFLYYFVFESVNGQTPGKLITGTKMILLSHNEDYLFLRIIVRTLLRFIPFDIFSYLFYRRGLHDWISKTDVIINQKSK
jgi:uncharacterized RDD family membrane protein YckC